MQRSLGPGILRGQITLAAFRRLARDASCWLKLGWGFVVGALPHPFKQGQFPRSLLIRTSWRGPQSAPSRSASPQGPAGAAACGARQAAADLPGATPACSLPRQRQEAAGPACRAAIQLTASSLSPITGSGVSGLVDVRDRAGSAGDQRAPAHSSGNSRQEQDHTSRCRAVAAMGAAPRHGRLWP